MNELAEFILEHYEPYRKWDRTILDGWLGWHCSQQFLFKAIDTDGSIVGVMIVRPIIRPQDADDFYAFDPEGNVAFIELLIATKPGVTQVLVYAALRRFGERPRVAWKRAPYFVTKFRETARCLKHVLRKEMIYGQ